ncbi:hypothetical protein [Cryptosporangium aurantiacum]|uniref:Uncharacterized protein n=1 Tax=Cryptosporangium aurantiacum TaxID=134849 RepID=A0A1M7MTZ8_9ACTN|nr:hypothetical protein [Cryptosporangium aurantiacum]SHM94506.1 hypothetical protein SAMN05443668_102268 [Cryptosporangium aurantiacum]
MQVTFRRLPDHEWGHVLIERDDHVVYRMHAGPITADLPHDLVHYTVEDTLGITDGIWGAIAGGVVFRSMTHVAGRRPPHAAERSIELIRAHRDRLQRAELIGGFVESAAHQPDADRSSLYGLSFATLADPPDVPAVERAVAALRSADERWRALPINSDLTLHWPAHRRLPAVPLGNRRRARR